jgi:CheY-like chemotaxis protein
MIKGYLENTQFTIIEAGDAEKAHTLIRAHKPAFVLMDIRMPGKSGYELTKELKADEELKHIPVVAFTASVMKEDAGKIKRLFDGYLSKPLNKQKLLNELKKFLQFSIVAKETQSPETKEVINMEIFKAEIGDELKEKLPDLVKILENDFSPKIEEVSDLLIIDDVEEIADGLKDIYEEYAASPLKNYYESLYDATQSFNSELMKKILEDFPKLIRSFKL